MEDLIVKVASFLFAIAILVTVHEFGHFWVARKLGVKVLKFSVGFGKALWSRVGKVDNTEYIIAAIPLGGYVKMLDEREAPVDETEQHRAFNRQSLSVRTAVVAAGPLFNFIFAIFAFWLVLILGETGLRPLVGEVVENTPSAAAGVQTGDEILVVNGQKTPTWGLVFYELAAASVSSESAQIIVKTKNGQEQQYDVILSGLDDFAELDNPLLSVGLQPERPSVPAIIGEIIAGEAAQQAGLKTGDKVIRVDGVAVADWVAWVKIIQKSPGKVMVLDLERDNKPMSLELIPASLEVNGETIGRIGARNQPVPGLLAHYQAVYQLGPIAAIPKAVEKTWDFSILTLKVLGRILIGEASVKNLSGPITLADAAGRTASVGLVQFLKFLAIISVSLGVLNLLPIPVLDGGHLAWYLYELIAGKEPSDAMMMAGQRVGMALLLGLMALAFYVDLTRFLF